MDTKDLCEHTRIRLIAAAIGHQQCTATAANIIPIPGGERFVVIGSLAEVVSLLHDELAGEPCAHCKRRPGDPEGMCDWMECPVGYAEPVAAPAHGHRGDFYLLANCRRLLGLMHSKRPNWSIASDLFATGSNSARQICLDAGIDPDGFIVERVVAPPSVKAGPLTSCAADDSEGGHHD